METNNEIKNKDRLKIITQELDAFGPKITTREDYKKYRELIVEEKTLKKEGFLQSLLETAISDRPNSGKISSRSIIIEIQPILNENKKSKNS
jgi:hypothetical protein